MIQQIGPRELYAKLTDNDTNEILVDVREIEEYTTGNIPGSESIPLNEIINSVDKLKKFATVYVTCNSGNRSREACSFLASQGVNVINVSGGFSAWKNAGLTTQGDGKIRIPILRQVMISAGCLVVAGLLLAVFVHSAWLLLPFIVGCGLIFGGITGVCTMAYLLQLMPWNGD